MASKIIDTLKIWGGRVAFSVGDQGIVSGTNFVLNILLIRWLTAEEYGAYAVGFSVFLFCSGFHNAFVLEPLSVFGAVRYSDRLPAYFGDLIIIHAGLTLGMGAILAMIAAILGANPLRAPLLGVALAMPFMLLFWLFRRMCYLEISPRKALRGSFVYGFLVFAGVLVLQRRGWVTSFRVFALMGIASIVAVLAYQISRDTNASLRTSRQGLHAVLQEHWKYGRWVGGSAFVYWLSNSIYLPLVGSFAGLAEAGIFQAMQNLVLPVQQTLVALGLLWLPWVSRRRSVMGESCLKQILPRITLVNALFSITYALALTLFGERIVELVYGKDLYTNYVWLLLCLGVVSILSALSQGLGTVLKAFERPDAMFWAQVVGTIVTLTLGLYLVWSLKLYGAAIGSLLTTALMLIASFYFVLRI